MADIRDNEGRHNPDGGIDESNPFGILALPGEELLTDAGGNALLRVEANGSISTVATFPSRVNGRTTDAVPTDVAVGPDGAYYVSELTGVPFATNAARIYRVVPGGTPTVYLTNFTTAIDLFGLTEPYVLEHSSGPTFFAAGEDHPDHARRHKDNGRDRLDRPTSMVIDNDGVIYVINHGISMGAGELTEDRAARASAVGQRAKSAARPRWLLASRHLSTACGLPVLVRSPLHEQIQPGPWSRAIIRVQAGRPAQSTTPSICQGRSRPGERLAYGSGALQLVSFGPDGLAVIRRHPRMAAAGRQARTTTGGGDV